MTKKTISGQALCVSVPSLMSLIFFAGESSVVEQAARFFFPATDTTK